MNGNTTNVILVLILVAVVALGVWFFAYRAEPESTGPSLNVELDGGSDASY